MSPYLKICGHCHCHGKFIFPDGKASQSFFVIERGTAILERARKLGQIDEFEHGILMSQLERSGLKKLEDLEKDFESDSQIMQTALEDFCAKCGDPSLN